MKPRNYGQWVKPTKSSSGSNCGCDDGGGIGDGCVCSLTGYLNRAPTLLGILNINDCADGIDVYPGPYEVTPHSYEQMLETAQQLMMDDVTVHAIPYWETSNLSDGLTAYIGN